MSSVWDLETSRIRHGPRWVAAPQEEEESHNHTQGQSQVYFYVLFHLRIRILHISEVWKQPRLKTAEFYKNMKQVGQCCNYYTYTE